MILLIKYFFFNFRKKNQFVIRSVKEKLEDQIKREQNIFCEKKQKNKQLFIEDATRSEPTYSYIKTQF